MESSPVTQNPARSCKYGKIIEIIHESTAGIRRQCYEVTDAYTNIADHGPCQFGAMDGCRLFDDRSNTFCLDDAPNHKDETGNGRDDRLEREEVTTVASSSVIRPNELL
jgi:hypothetical protein